MCHSRWLTTANRLLRLYVSTENPSVREFRVPLLNFNAEDFTNLVQWQDIDRCEPPLLKELTDEDIAACVKASDTTRVHEIAHFPCHTQATERYNTIEKDDENI